MTQDALALYTKYYVSTSYERLGLFTLVAASFASRHALYPGSFTHVTPAFVYPHTCFVDTERRAERFFADPAVRDFVNERKVYSEEPRIRFHRADYVQELPEAEESYDLLISQYAGFVSQHCKRYLKVGGMLLANNSHGDASMAWLDQDFALVAAIKRRGERFSLVETNLAPTLCLSGITQYPGVSGTDQARRGVYAQRLWIRLSASALAPRPIKPGLGVR